MAEAYIYDHVRTPRGKGKSDGSLHEVTALALATAPLKAIKERNNLAAGSVDDVVLGVVDPVGEAGGDISRFAALQAGLGTSVPGVQISRFCASGLDAVNFAAAQVMAGQHDLTSQIRTEEVSAAASIVSQLPEVREKLRLYERDLATSHPVGAIVEGRDSGTVVFPDASLKFFLTASAEVRAQRRHAEYLEKGLDISFDQVYSDLVERDRRDTAAAVQRRRLGRGCADAVRRVRVLRGRDRVLGGGATGRRAGDAVRRAAGRAGVRPPGDGLRRDDEGHAREHDLHRDRERPARAAAADVLALLDVTRVASGSPSPERIDRENVAVAQRTAIAAVPCAEYRRG